MDNNTNNPALQGNSNGPAKKQWQKPDLYLLDTSKINTGSGIAHHEGSINLTLTNFPATQPPIRQGTINGRPTPYFFDNYQS